MPDYNLKITEKRAMDQQKLTSPIPLSLEPFEKTLRNNPDNNTILDFCLLRCDHPEKHLQVVGSRGLLRKREKPLRSDSLAYERKEVLRGPRDNQRQLRTLQTVMDAIFGMDGDTPRTVIGGDEDSREKSDSRSDAYMSRLVGLLFDSNSVIEEAYKVLNGEK